MNLKTSARNRFTGVVMQVNSGTAGDEVVTVLDDSGTRIISMVTAASTKALGLEPGKKVVILIKATWVILVSDMGGVRFATRNQLPGTVVSIKEGVVSAEVRVRLDGGEVITSVVTKESVKHLELEAGKRVTAMVKATNPMIGVFD